jgi:DNA-binding NarL/FixJ family response regulator
MIVDDNRTYLRIAKRFLETQASHLIGATATADSVAAAVRLGNVFKPHVVLLDLNMPETSGLQAIPMLREAVPGVRIIVVTLLDEAAYRGAAAEAGADAFVAKSALADELVPAIAAVLGRKPRAVAED